MSYACRRRTSRPGRRLLSSGSRWENGRSRSTPSTKSLVSIRRRSGTSCRSSGRDQSACRRARQRAGCRAADNPFCRCRLARRACWREFGCACHEVFPTRAPPDRAVECSIRRAAHRQFRLPGENCSRTARGAERSVTGDLRLDDNRASALNRVTARRPETIRHRPLKSPR